MGHDENYKLGIIAGSGDLPMRLAEDFAHKGGEVVVALLDGYATHDFHAFPNQKFKLGEIARGLDFFGSHGVTNLVMAGGVKRPNFLNLKVDKLAARLVAQIVKAKIMGDDRLLRIVAAFFEHQGFKILSPMSVFSGQATIDEDVVTLLKPSSKEYADIKIGAIDAKDLGKRDIGQSVIVFDGKIIDREDEKGTDVLINRAATPGAILVKMMKPMQDNRLDIPTIGEETIRKLAQNGFKGVAVEANKVIIVNLEATIKLADEMGIFIVGYRI